MSLLSKNYDATKVAQPKFDGVRISINGRQFTYKDADKNCSVEIKDGNHLRSLVAKAISNASDAGKQLESYCEFGGCVIDANLLNEVGQQIVNHNKSIRNDADRPDVGRHYLRPNWMPNA